MNEIALNLGLLTIAILLTIGGALLGASYQQRNWRFQNWERLREERVKQAVATVEVLAKLVDRRLYRQRRLLWASRSGASADIEIALKDYRAAIIEWMDNFGHLKAELWRSFDRYTAIQFEEEIHTPFASIGRKIEEKIRRNLPNLLSEEERQLDRLGRSSYQFVHMLLERIATEDLNGLRGRDSVSFENWDRLSISFLTKRLFGISS
jgi:hypothetical protein